MRAPPLKEEATQQNITSLRNAFLGGLPTGREQRQKACSRPAHGDTKASRLRFVMSVTRNSSTTQSCFPKIFLALPSLFESTVSPKKQKPKVALPSLGASSYSEKSFPLVWRLPWSERWSQMRTPIIRGDLRKKAAQTPQLHSYALLDHATLDIPLVVYT